MSGLSVSATTLPTGDGVCRVMCLAGEADLTTASLRDALASEVAARPRLLLLDMSALTFIDSAAMQMIIGAFRVLRGEGGTLALVRPGPMVARVLNLLGVGHLIRIYGSVDEAVSAAS